MHAAAKAAQPPATASTATAPTTRANEPPSGLATNSRNEIEFAQQPSRQVPAESRAGAVGGSPAVVTAHADRADC